MKEKAVFLCNQKGSVDRVYTNNAETMRKLANELEFPAEIINAENIGQFKDFTNECKYIFSTWGMTNLKESDIKKYFGKCEVIFYGAGSVQYFAREYLNCGIKISSAWVSNGISVAEYTVSQILLACKGYFKIAGKVKSRDDWRGTGKISGANYPGNYNTKIGLLGVGTIGKRVIEYLKRLEIKTDILVYDPYYSEEEANKAGVRKASLEEIFKTCHVVSNHIANLPTTVGMINKNHFSLMQDYSTFINTGRGAQIVESDMIDALKNNPTLTALIDVTDPVEPPEPDNELYKLENVILTPHIAGVTGNEALRLSDFMYGEYKLYSEEKRLNYEVTLEMLEYMA